MMFAAGMQAMVLTGKGEVRTNALRFDPKTARWSAPERVDIGPTKAHEDYPGYLSAARSPRGDFAVGADRTGYNPWSNRFDPITQTWDGPRPLPESLNDLTLEQFFFGANFNLYGLWRGRGLLCVARYDAATKSWLAPIQLAARPLEFSGTFYPLAAEVDETGRVTVAWSLDKKLLVAQAPSDSEPFGAPHEFDLPRLKPGSPPPREWEFETRALAIDLTSLGAGKVMLSWMASFYSATQRGDGPFVSIFDPAKGGFGAPVMLADHTGEEPQHRMVQHPSGDVTLFWVATKRGADGKDSYALRARHLNATAGTWSKTSSLEGSGMFNPVGSELSVHALGEDRVWVTFVTRRSDATAFNAPWRGISVSVFDVKQNAFGTPVQVHEPEKRVGDLRVVVTACKTAAFLWQERESDEPKYKEKGSLHLDWLDTESLRLLASERVGRGWIPSLTATADCNLVAVWDDDGTKVRGFQPPAH
jgi:hypothetical protein